MPRRALLVTAGLVALTALLPFLDGLLAGRVFFFRDLGSHYFPQRHFAIEGLLQGEPRYWNPLAYEGVPAATLYYPLDLLQVVRNDDQGASWLLALHVPLAALAALLLGRGLGLAPPAAAGLGLSYALGGFVLSSLNLVVHLQSAAWAPLVVLGVMQASRGGRRNWVLGALPTAVALSTYGFEVAAQAVLVGIALSVRRARAGAAAAGILACLLLAAGLASPVLLASRSFTLEGSRAAGLPTEMALAFSLHPVALLQVVVAGLFGDLPTCLRSFWGHRFFDGFPYYLSLYLGAAGLALAAVGAMRPKPYSTRLGVVALVGLWVALGAHAGLGRVLALVPLLRAFRFPVKAFFLVHMGVALLIGTGLDVLARGDSRPAWKRLAGLALAAGAGLVLLPLVLGRLPGFTPRLWDGFFPQAYSALRRREAWASLASDAALGGLAALGLGLIALAVLRKRLSCRAGAIAVTAVMAADLVRAGAAVNPMVGPALFRPAAPQQRLTARLSREGGRLFTCVPSASRTLLAHLMGTHGRTDVTIAGILFETLSPLNNMRLGVPAAYGIDHTGFTPPRRTLSSLEASCADFGGLLPRLRRAGVSRVISLDPLVAPGAVPEEGWPSRVLQGRPVHVYRLERPLPLREVARKVVPARSAADAEERAAASGFQDQGGVAVEGLEEGMEGAGGRVVSVSEAPDRVELLVEAERPSVVIVRDGYSPGWGASVAGAPAPVLRADGRHRAIPIPAGRSRVVLTYRPWSLWPGRAVSLVSALAALGLLFWPRRDVRSG